MAGYIESTQEMLATIILSVTNHRTVMRINRIIAGICCVLTMSLALGCLLQ